jgi:predicted secreted protein
MIADVRDKLRAIPFVPFSIRTSDGREYNVPTVDYAFMTPRGNRIVIATDEDSTVVLGPLHINAIIDSQSAAG